MPSVNKTIIDFTWRGQAACKGVSTQLFFPTRGEVVSKELKQMCLDCPVNAECLDHALRHEHYGFWAGTSEEQRISIRRKLNIVCNKPEAMYWMGTREEKARVEANRMDKIKGRGRKPASCGTRSGYGAHLSKKESPCDACKEAQRKGVAEFNLKKKMKEQGLDYE